MARKTLSMTIENKKDENGNNILDLGVRQASIIIKNYTEKESDEILEKLNDFCNNSFENLEIETIGCPFYSDNEYGDYISFSTDSYENDADAIKELRKMFKCFKAYLKELKENKPAAETEEKKEEKLTSYTVLARLDNELDGTNNFYEETESFKTKKEFISHMKSNGFKFKYKDVKETELYNIIVKNGDCFAWDCIHTMKEYNKYIENKFEYECNYDKRITKKSKKQYATILEKKHKKELERLFGKN